MKLIRSIGLVLGAIALSFATIVLSSVPLLVLRRIAGSGLYWILTLTAGLALVLTGKMALWAPFLSIVILVGLYAELESLGLRIENAALGALSGTGGFIALNLAALKRMNGLHIGDFVRDGVTELVARVQLMEPTLKLDVASIVPQIPSALLILLMFSLWVALVADRKLQLATQPTPELSSFKVPDVFVWVLLVGVVANFIEFADPRVKAVGENLFNVMVYVYFLQGMAIVGTYFKTFKVGLLWRGLGYFILIGQLFLLASFIGFVDLWIDFRRRLVKKSAETMREV